MNNNKTIRYSEYGFEAQITIDPSSTSKYLAIITPKSNKNDFLEVSASGANFKEFLKSIREQMLSSSHLKEFLAWLLSEMETAKPSEEEEEHVLA